MLTVTGYVKNGDTYLKDPIIRVEAHFLLGNVIDAEAHAYASAQASAKRIATVGFPGLSKTLVNGVNGNGYDGSIQKLETALKTLIENNNPGTTVVIS